MHVTLGRFTVNSYRNASLTSRGQVNKTQLQLLIFSLKREWEAKTVIGLPLILLHPWNHWKWVSLQWGCHICRNCHLRYHLGQVLTHDCQSLLKGRGLLFADQQMIANEKTVRLVRVYASDDGSIFWMDFAWAMMKMSGLNVLTGSQGQVQRNCFLALVSF